MKLNPVPTALKKHSESAELTTPSRLADSAELSFLNKNHSFSLAPLQSPAAKGVLSKLRARLRNWILGDYLNTEQQYQAELVRHLNSVSSSVDSLREELHREIARINDNNSGTFRSIERTVVDQLNAAHSAADKRLGAINATQNDHLSRLKTLESVSAGLERIIASLKPASVPNTSLTAKESPVSSLPPALPDFTYLMLENRYRGSESEIKDRLRVYPPIFQAAKAPILEIGCGRGELLELFKEAKIPAYGAELDSGMIAWCKEKGLEVQSTDGIAHLRSLPDKSLGGLIATQVIEHLQIETLTELLKLCASKIQPGGRIVLETINSGSIVALTQHYFRDPTHVWPLHPETMRYLMELAGLKTLEIKTLAPFPPEAQLVTLPIADHLTPRWVETISTLNHNFERLNALLYGFQDYCIIAEA